MHRLLTLERSVLVPCVAVAALVTLTGAGRAQGLPDVNISGTWSLSVHGTFTDTSHVKPQFKRSTTVFLQQGDTQVLGTAKDKDGPCGVFLVPLGGFKSGTTVAFSETSLVHDHAHCDEIGTFHLNFAAQLLDGAHGSVSGDGNLDAQVIQSGVNFTGTMKRISGMQTPTDPDGDGPAVAVSLIGSGEPGQLGAHDLAVTRLKVPKSAKGTASKPALVKVTVQIQNRGQHDEVIADAETLARLVTVRGDPGSAGPAVLGDLLPPGAGKFPITLAPRHKLAVRFVVRLTADAPPEAASTDVTFSWSAGVDHRKLPGDVQDDHIDDDVAPRSVIAPFTFDAYPDGKIKERGVGAKQADKTFGGRVLTVLVT